MVKSSYFLSKHLDEENCTILVQLLGMLFSLYNCEYILLKNILCRNPNEYN